MIFHHNLLTITPTTLSTFRLILLELTELFSLLMFSLLSCVHSFALIHFIVVLITFELNNLVVVLRVNYRMVKHEAMAG